MYVVWIESTFENQCHSALSLYTLHRANSCSFTLPGCVCARAYVCVCVCACVSARAHVRVFIGVGVGVGVFCSLIVERRRVYL
jgi:hypothetical protein